MKWTFQYDVYGTIQKCFHLSNPFLSIKEFHYKDTLSCRIKVHRKEQQNLASISYICYCTRAIKSRRKDSPMPESKIFSQRFAVLPRAATIQWIWTLHCITYSSLTFLDKQLGYRFTCLYKTLLLLCFRVKGYIRLPSLKRKLKEAWAVEAVSEKGGQE
jgi:hypothetical protein